MTKSISLLLISFCLLFFLTIYATANDKPDPYEEIFPEIGYKTVEDALDDFEQHFKHKPKLPLRVPPISFTHHFGRFNNLDGDMNDYFEVKMISDQSPQNHFKIDVRPIQHKHTFEKYISNVFKLKNGKDATYIKDQTIGFNLLVFERDNWQYVLGIDTDVSDKVTPEILVQIANSIDF
ncbi:hypothetical protein [Psychrobacillus sp.]|uniref:hypothetical protein n=1 Tax=Psychrobacillus sp. TaxID=1871623 RepID=UPI0028BDA444|nr:hypothetical protein [Psychrobacillus sp.]